MARQHRRGVSNASAVTMKMALEYHKRQMAYQPEMAAKSASAKNKGGVIISIGSEI
jgi:hypothetical protein